MSHVSPATPNGFELNETVAYCHALIGELLHSLAVMLQRLTELEGRLKLNCRNSSKSFPSDVQCTDCKAASSKPKSSRKRGDLPSHKKHARAMVGESELNYIACAVPQFCACGSALPPCGRSVPHQVFDLPPLGPVVTEYHRQGRGCQCGEYALPLCCPQTYLQVSLVHIQSTLSACGPDSSNSVSIRFMHCCGKTYGWISAWEPFPLRMAW
ncbi:DUF6444 domain-containing protein [Chromobacterium violaceum]|uniref:DUF6444 domain-containing protein n=1 Tax=Chromobacterium violaceum TaxID=536 RepID=UPI001CE09400